MENCFKLESTSEHVCAFGTYVTVIYAKFGGFRRTHSFSHTHTHIFSYGDVCGGPRKKDMLVGGQRRRWLDWNGFPLSTVYSRGNIICLPWLPKTRIFGIIQIHENFPKIKSLVPCRQVEHYTHATQNHFIYIFIVRAILPTILVQNLFVCVSKHKRFEVCFFVVVGWGDVEHLVWLRMYPIVIEHHESRFVSRRSDLQCGDFSTIHIYSSELGD